MASTTVKLRAVDWTTIQLWKLLAKGHSKVEIFLEQREVAFLSPNKLCENLNFSTVHL